ncbi:pupal cuticle protein 20-like [Aethina tumida]|uniref:pupal cuticle protein 20-like n=1 Tax=Aethina tumida TaxID=116153 RepID=UPI00096B1F33|nr:pupal cuticle protein 20-like [Aethina tumida]
MYKFLLVVALFYICQTASAEGPEIPILASENVLENDGKFHYSYESGDGTKVHEEGEVLPGAKPEEGLEKVQGGFEFNSPDGQHFVYSYTADENGYVPQGDGIPEIPAAIVKSLEWNAAHPEKR